MIRNKVPYILKVGSRSSSNYYRIYQKTKEINHSVFIESTEGLRFELEIKKDFIKSFQQFLFNNRIDEFEEKLTQHFFNQSRQNFGFNFSYTDWPERVEYQNRQLEFLQSSKKKLREGDRLRLSEDSKLKLLTEEEKDALNYFSGTGFYQSHQDLKTPPNRFDTRETFLKKMQDFEMRNNFLKAYNQRISFNDR